MKVRRTTVLPTRSLRGLVLLLLHCWVGLALPAAHAAAEARARPVASVEGFRFAGGPSSDRPPDAVSIGALAPDADAHDRGSCTLCRAADAPAEVVLPVAREFDGRVVARPEIVPPRLAVAAAVAIPSARAPPPLG